MANLTGFPGGFPLPTSEAATTPYPIQLGTRARDGAGNEYVFCEFGTVVSAEQPVSISAGYVASALGTTGRGPVGVACGAGTSAEAGWVQIYGRCLVQLGMSGVSPSDDANGPTTLQTSAKTVFMLGTSLSSPNGVGWTSAVSTAGYWIEGMEVADDASVSNEVSGVTSATSHTGNHVAVFLNYPKVVYRDFAGAATT